jgi:hypothetical protein
MFARMHCGLTRTILCNDNSVRLIRHAISASKFSELKSVRFDGQMNSSMLHCALTEHGAGKLPVVEQQYWQWEHVDPSGAAQLKYPPGAIPALPHIRQQSEVVCGPWPLQPHAPQLLLAVFPVLPGVVYGQLNTAALPQIIPPHRMANDMGSHAASIALPAAPSNECSSTLSASM